jgi:ribosomal protein L9
MHQDDIADYLTDGKFSKIKKEKAALAAALEAKDATIKAIETKREAIAAKKEARIAKREALQKKMKSTVFTIYAKDFSIKEISETL